MPQSMRKNNQHSSALYPLQSLQTPHKEDGYRLRKNSDFFEERLDVILKNARWYNESDCPQKDWESRRRASWTY